MHYDYDYDKKQDTKSVLQLMILRGGPPLYALSVDDFKRWAPQLMLVGLTRFTLDTYEAETSADSIIGSILDNSKNNP